MSVPHGIRQIEQVYGKPYAGPVADPSWAKANLVSFDPPYQMRTAWDGKPVSRITVHKLVMPELLAILTDICNDVRIMIKHEIGWDKTSEEYDALTIERIRSLGLDRFGGAYVHRVKRGGSSLSTHAYGIAIDLDPARNALGDTTPAMPSFVVNAFEKRGWLWGGRWKGRNCDGMHFQRATGY